MPPTSKEQYSEARPTRILSKANLRKTWNLSRDSGKKPGIAGIDGVRARTYGNNLDENLTRLSLRIRDGSFSFVKLRAAFIPKSGKGERVICIPTVEDRLVQRAIVSYLYDKRVLPIYNKSSYGFIPGEEFGIKKAISRCLELRHEYDYVFETDITSFFDNISRNILSESVDRHLGKHSLRRFLQSAIRREIKPRDKDEANKLPTLGIKPGQGLRQGMPLSPVLANLALGEFDRAIERTGAPMVRYADDIVVFCKSESEAYAMQEIVRCELSKLGQDIPPVDDGSKTKIARKMQGFEFLGRRIYFSDCAGKYVQEVPKRKVEKIKDKIIDLSDVNALIEKGYDITDSLNRIRVITNSYVNHYSDAYNAVHLENELRFAYNYSMKAIFKQIFGNVEFSKITRDHLKFLGIQEYKEQVELFDIH